jgi:two-component system chemotaxis response regulator CheB
MYPPQVEAPPDVVAQAAIAEKEAIGIEQVKNLGRQSVYSCPDCGGALWQITNENITEYRCHVGHSFSERQLILRKGETLETTLWIALRILEERKNIFEQTKELNLKKGLHSLAEENEDQINIIDVHINQLKEILFSTVVE